MTVAGRLHAMDKPSQKVGVLGYLSVFGWSVFAVMLAPARFLPWVAVLSLLIAAVIYPRSLRSIMRLRWLIMIIILALPPVFLVGELDRSLGSLRYSSEGLVASMQIGIRILVVLIAINGLTSSADITSVAGLLEHAGLHGIGFSVGVTLNTPLTAAIRTKCLAKSMDARRFAQATLTGHAPHDRHNHGQRIEPGGGNSPGGRSARFFSRTGTRLACQEWEI